MSNNIETYYDDFSKKLLRDYVYGNARVSQQFCFFKDAMHPDTESILVIGCSSGKGAYFLARKTARKARITVVDISGNKIEILCRHPRTIQSEFGLSTISLRWTLRNYLKCAKRNRVTAGGGKLVQTARQLSCDFLTPKFY